jgi:hypothetical protein
MNYFLLQLFIVAQKQDFEKWMNILFLVVLAAFWLIGGIVKVKSEQAKRQKSKSPPRDTAARPASTKRDTGELILEKILGSFIPDSGNQRRPAIQKSITKSPATREGSPRLNAKTKSNKYALRQKISQLRKQKLLMQKQSVEPKFRKLTPIDANINKLKDFTSDSVKKLDNINLKAPAEKPVSHYLLDFSDTDSIKKAILYYEVLGRPLSLRDSSSSFTEL